MRTPLSRRDFLKTAGLTGLALTAGPRLFLRSARADAPANGPVIVHVFQRGGMDGLSAVVPFADRDYYSLRRSTAIARPKKGDDQTAIDLDGRFGLHPALRPLAADYAAGRLAVVHAIGSTDPTRSHFDAQDYMESGTPGRKGTASGWMNRFVAGGGANGDAFRAVSITPVLPRVMKGEAHALALAGLDGFRMGDRGFLGDAFTKMYEHGGDDVVHESGQEAIEAIERLRSVNPQRFKPENGAEYPRSRLGPQMLTIAQLIKAGVGVECAFAEIGGWDTHLNQGGATGGLANRLAELSGSIHAFLTDLGDRAKDVVVVTLTEFGRTAKENGTNGTDHGHASVCFVAGGAVRGGKVHCRWPGLAEGRLWQKRDLAVTTDFRDVLSEVLTHHMGAKDLDAVFPGHRPKNVGLFRG